MPSPLRQVEFKDMAGTTLAKGRARVGTAQVDAIQTPDQVLARDVRTVRVVQTPGTSRIRVNQKAVIGDDVFTVFRVQQEGRWLDVDVERTP